MIRSCRESFPSKLLLLLVIFWGWGSCSLTLAQGDREEIRVLLQEGVEQVTIVGTRSYQILSPSSPLLHLSRQVTIRAEKKGMIIAKVFYPVQRLLFRSSQPENRFGIGSYQYRGELEVRQTGPGRLQVINVVPLRYYLYGVLPQEIDPDWKMEVLKAQAVAARTYALYRKMGSAGREYDVRADVWDQLYRGYTGEDPRTNRAVDETAGEILVYKGKPIAAYYHADAGGYTEDSRYVWSISYPYLQSVRSFYGADSPYATWELTLSTTEIGRRFRAAGYPLDEVTGVTVVQRSPTGRVLLVKVHHKRGVLWLKGTTFRKIIGINTLLSTLFWTQKKGGKIHFQGRGWGHGVGLSQWGAKEMAELGFTYPEILQFYYRGVTLTQVNGRKDTP
ncbi:MAG: SpoIID/LytB domain-containing protein [Nitrospinota bacterium]|nr:MAG: SpoIID/LytB domain-containing protein [Nitrospinota bacterium]